MLFFFFFFVIAFDHNEQLHTEINKNPNENFCCYIFSQILISFLPNNCCVMVSLLASSVVDHGFESRSGQTKDYIKLAFVAFPLSTQH